MCILLNFCVRNSHSIRVCFMAGKSKKEKKNQGYQGEEQGNDCGRAVVSDATDLEELCGQSNKQKNDLISCLQLTT